MNLPILTEADPVTSSEGSLDPLGLFAIADSLGVKLVPGVRERQSHPRFLTAIAVSLALCSEFDEQEIAKDGVSDPWQVFEWYLVEGLVRTLTDEDNLKGLPGRLKVAAAIHDNVPLSASRYLKTPTVFGFHGVYRTLARELEIDTAGRLGETGYELLTAWSAEQELAGFHDSSKGDGRWWRDYLVKAVRDGLEAGAVARKGGWQGWGFFRDYLAHHDFGPKEAEVIWGALLRSGSGHRRQVLEFLVSAPGRSIRGEINSERVFHRALLDRCDSDLMEFLRAIMTYETFARLLQDAFDDCLFLMSRTRSKTGIGELTDLRGVRLAVEQVPDLFMELSERLSAFGEVERFNNNFHDLAPRMNQREWTETLLEHHRIIQRKKPPNGKSPWYERFDDGSYVIRPAYIRRQGGRYSDDYVHAYRTGPLESFAVDLGRVRV